MQRFFITAPGTGVGKTLVTTALTWQLRQAGKQVAALKPVISGYDPKDEQSDTALILKSLGIAPTAVAAKAVSPWQYRLPLSPDMAAEREGEPPVELEELISFCRDHSGKYLLVEGVGGIMSPINHRHTVLDWMAALGWPAIVVTGSYLGAISHTLMSLEVLQTRQVPVKAVVISESESGVSLDDTMASLKRFVFPSVPVVTISRIAASGDLWKQVPSISGVCA